LGEEEEALGFGFDEGGAGVSEVGGDGVAGGAADRGEAGFGAFAGDADPAFFEAEAFEAGAGEFGEAEAGGVEEFEDGAVAAGEGVVGGDGFEELADLLFVEGVREGEFLAGREDGFGGIADAVATGDEPAEEDFHGDEFDAGAGGGEAVFFALDEVVGEVGGGDVGRGFDLVLGFEPIGEGFEDAADEELVVDGEAALGGEVEDEGVDGGEHPSEGGVCHGWVRVAMGDEFWG
jgi:hypothetical protein